MKLPVTVVLLVYAQIYFDMKRIYMTRLPLFLSLSLRVVSPPPPHPAFPLRLPLSFVNLILYLSLCIKLLFHD